MVGGRIYFEYYAITARLVSFSENELGNLCLRNTKRCSKRCAQPIWKRKQLKIQDGRANGAVAFCIAGNDVFNTFSICIFLAKCVISGALLKEQRVFFRPFFFLKAQLFKYPIVTVSELFVVNGPVSLDDFVKQIRRVFIAGEN